MSLDKILVQKTAQNLIGHFDSQAQIEIQTQEGSIQINIDTTEPAVLIGRHGQTLMALEHVLRLLLAKESEEFIPLAIDIGGYRALRRKKVEEEAKIIAEKVLESGVEEGLSPMNAYERRIVHLILEDLEGIEAGSEGEEPYRKIIIRKK